MTVIRDAEMVDASPIANIYNHYIATSHATFELEAVDGAEMCRRINVAREANHPFIVYMDRDTVVGYAYAREFRPRAAYRHSIEISVYVKSGHEGKGVGTSLYEKLISRIEKGDYHTIIAGISLPNDASVRLHEKFGFTKSAHFYEVGLKFNRWIDVGYWQKTVATPEK